MQKQFVKIPNKETLHERKSKYLPMFYIDFYYANLKQSNFKDNIIMYCFFKGPEFDHSFSSIVDGIMPYA